MLTPEGVQTCECGLPCEHKRLVAHVRYIGTYVLKWHFEQSSVHMPGTGSVEDTGFVWSAGSTSVEMRCGKKKKKKKKILSLQ